jgi:hypothetical protein
MEHLEDIKLDDIKIYNPWAEAPKGTILQVLVDDHIHIGMRVTDALLIIAGKRAGDLIDDENLMGAALDIGEAVEIVAREPVPFGQDSSRLKPGTLLRSKAKVYFVSIASQGVPCGFVCVASDDPTIHSVGEHVSYLSPSDYMGVAQKIGIRLR